MAKGWLRGMFGKGEPPATPQDVLGAFQQALALHHEGRLADAGTAYARVLALQPGHFDALHLSGLVHYQRGEDADAVRLIEKAIALDPKQAATHSNLGLALQRLGRTQDALASYDRALAIEPGFAAALFNRGNALRDLGRLEDALACHERVIRLSPGHPEALNNRGLLLKELNRNAEALASLDLAVAAQPDNAEALNNRGAVRSALGRHADALADWDAAISIRPDYAEAHNNRAATLGALERFDEALAGYARALAIDPGYADALYNQAALYSRLKNHAAALDSYDKALALRPQYVEAANGRGTTLREMGRAREALAAYDQALAMRPDFAEALDNRGVVLATLGRHEEALASHDRALALRPDFPAALSNRASVLRETGERDAALEAYRRAVDADPRSLATRFKRLVACLPVLARDVAEIAQSRKQFLAEAGLLEEWVTSHPLEDAQQAVGAAQPFHLAYQEQNNRDLLSRYGTLCSRLMADWQRRSAFTGAAPPDAVRDRMRVGIVSAHIHSHSVWNAIVKGWLQEIDKNRFEIEVFHLGTAEDTETEFAIARCDRFTHGDRRLEDWMATLAERRLDVLIYPEVGMDITTPRLASMRLAPVQVAAWGHPETTGFPTIDYYLSAESFETADSQANYTEKLIALPNLGCYYAPEEVMDLECSAVDLRMSADSPLFICPGTPFKYAPEHDSVFVRIAHRLENARFVFFTFEPVPLLSQRLRERIGKAFADGGLDASKHIVFIPWQPKAAFYALLRKADAFLDTIGFSGFNTAMQAVECGLPIITLEGRFMRGKFASAILKRMHLDELAASDDESYVECAVRLGGDRDYNARIRHRLAAARDVLYRDAAPIRALEDFLTGMKTGRAG